MLHWSSHYWLLPHGLEMDWRRRSQMEQLKSPIGCRLDEHAVRVYVGRDMLSAKLLADVCSFIYRVGSRLSDTMQTASHRELALWCPRRK